MFLFNKKKREIAKLKDYILRMKDYYGDSINSSKIHLIHTLEWLVGYYENRTASTPKEFLESMMREIPLIQASHTEYQYIDLLKKRNEQILFLYNWIYYKKIVGF